MTCSDYFPITMLRRTLTIPFRDHTLSHYNPHNTIVLPKQRTELAARKPYLFRNNPIVCLFISQIHGPPHEQAHRPYSLSPPLPFLFHTCICKTSPSHSILLPSFIFMLLPCVSSKSTSVPVAVLYQNTSPAASTPPCALSKRAKHTTPPSATGTTPATAPLVPGGQGQGKSENRNLHKPQWCHSRSSWIPPLSDPALLNPYPNLLLPNASVPKPNRSRS